MSESKTAKTSKQQPVRLYSKAKFCGFLMSLHKQRCHTSVCQIEGVNTSKETSFYLGKRIAYIYKAKNEKNGSRHRCIWGRITRAHGTNGLVRAKFRKNLPPRAMGATLRVMLFPSHV